MHLLGGLRITYGVLIDYGYLNLSELQMDHVIDGNASLLKKVFFSMVYILAGGEFRRHVY